MSDKSDELSNGKVTVDTGFNFVATQKIVALISLLKKIHDQRKQADILVAEIEAIVGGYSKWQEIVDILDPSLPSFSPRPSYPDPQDCSREFEYNFPPATNTKP